MAVVDHREEAVLGPGACRGGQDDEVRYEANLQPGFKVSVKGKRRGGVRARARLNPSAAGLVALRVRGYSPLTVVLNSCPGDRPPEIYG